MDSRDLERHTRDDTGGGEMSGMDSIDRGSVCVVLARGRDFVWFGLVTSTKAAGKAATKKEEVRMGWEERRGEERTGRPIVQSSFSSHHPVVVVVVNKNTAALP